MRRIALVVFASCALFLGACGSDGGGNGEGDNAGASADVNAKVDGDAAGATAAATACEGREAVNFASTYAQAMSQSSSSNDYKGFAEALRKAADASPSEIRADFRVVADAVGPFLELFVSANGNYMQLAQDPEFEAKANRVGSDEVQQASNRVNAWFTEHCGS